MGHHEQHLLLNGPGSSEDEALDDRDVLRVCPPRLSGTVKIPLRRH